MSSIAGGERPSGGRSGPAQVTVDPGRPIGRLDRGVFGGFVEHLGRCIYGGLFDEGSALSDDRGFRRDVLDLLRPLKLSVLRWPGGNFVSNYHWADGVGPRSSRPARPNVAWGGVESNRFGTDEFLAYCAELGVTPYICLNMGTGDLAEALDWVEYCNSAASTYWAQQRRENGHTEPYGVIYWGLGNEMYGDWQVGQLAAPDYVAVGFAVGQGPAPGRPANKAGELRGERLERLGQGRDRRPGRPGRPAFGTYLFGFS